MAVTQYVGARYVPLFADPLEWDKNTPYESFIIVYNNGNSYTSKQYVPAGIDISNESYWALTGNYNAQIEQYRAEVKQYDARITANDTAIKAEVERATAAEATKAPTSHASETAVYGVGNETLYGHVRLAVENTPATSDATAGIAATPKVVNDAVAAASNTLQTSIDAIEGDVADLKNSVGKGETIDSLYVIGDSYLEGYNPEGSVTGFGNVIKRALKVSTYKQDAQGGSKWDSSTAERITSAVNNYDVLLIALGHNNMTSNNVTVSQHVADTLNKLETLGYKGKVFLCSTLATAKYTCQKMLEVDNNIVLGMQTASYSFPCAFLANGWSWLVDSADYGTADKGQHPKQAGQNLIAANIISGMYGGNTLNAAHAYGNSGGVYVSRVMMNVVISVLGAKGNDGTVVYKPALPFNVVDTYFFVMQGNDGSVKNMSFKSAEGAKITYQNVTNAVYGSAMTTLPENAPA
jgi:hypothetical protein